MRFEYSVTPDPANPESLKIGISVRRGEERFPLPLGAMFCTHEEWDEFARQHFVSAAAA